MYDGFISYSHSADGQLAPALQRGLQRFAKPWWRRRALRLFRDQTGLSANPELWGSITTAMDESRWFILLASPGAAASEWVGREIDHWVTTRGGPDNMLVAVTEGTFTWDAARGDIDVDASTAAHPALRGLFAAEPRHVDLSWVRNEVQLDPRDGRFRDAIADLAAPLRGVPKDELAGDDVRLHRRAIRLAWSAATTLAVLTVGAILATVVAVNQTSEARDQRAAAAAERDAAEEQSQQAIARGEAAYAVAQAPLRLDRSLLLGAEAINRRPSAATSIGVLTALDAARHLVGFHPELGDDMRAADVSPNRTEVTTLDGQGHVRRWKADDWSLLAETTTQVAKPEYLKYHTDGTISVEGSGETERLDRETLVPAGPLLVAEQRDDLAGNLVYLSLSNDGSHYLVMRYHSDAVEVYDTATRQLAATVEVGDDCPSGLFSANWHPDGERVAVNCEVVGQGVTVYEWRTGRVVAGPGVDTGVSDATSSQDGSMMVLGTFTNQVAVVRTDTLENVVPIIDVPGGRAYGGTFSPDGRYVAIGTDDGSVVVWDLASDVEVGRVGGLDEGILGLEWLDADFAVDERQRVSGSSRLVVLTASALTEWDVAQPSVVGSPRTVPLPGHEPRCDYAVDPAGQLGYGRPEPEVTPGPDSSVPTVVYPPGPAAVLVHSLVDGAEVRRFAVDADLASSYRLNPDGSQLLLAAHRYEPGSLVPAEIELQLVRTADGSVTWRAPWPANFPPPPPPSALPADSSTRLFTCMQSAFSPDGSRLAVMQRGGPAVLLDAATGGVLASGQTEPNSASLAWSPDGGRLFVARIDGPVDIFDGTTLELVTTTPFRLESTVDVIFAPQLKVMVVTSEGGEVRLMDPATGAFTGEPFRAGGSQLQGAAVSPDGTRLAAWSRDGTIRVWDVATRLPLGPPLQGHTPGAPLAALWFSSTDRLTTFEAVSSRMIDWDLGLDRLADRACTLVGRSLTEVEWRQYVGEDVPYEPTCHPG